MSTPTFDFAFIGAGAAGSHLAFKMAQDPFFQDKSVLILDKDSKKTNDRTWSFWEKGASHWDEIVEREWEQAIFQSQAGERSNLDLKEYRYKTIRSSKFYEYVKSAIHSASNFTWLTEEVVEVNDSSIKTSSGLYQANHIFDSRVDPAFEQEAPNYASLSQHFLGWFIETPTDCFDDSAVTMMDYRLQWKDHTSFTYILPFTPRFALVEFTLFNTELLEKSDYEEKLKTYITDFLDIKSYEITETEYGIIPMSNYPFSKHHSEKITKIGTAGGWVRPSSGYSFKNADRYSNMVIENIKRGKAPSHGVAKTRYRFYDSIFLNVLKDENALGPDIFETLYTKHPTSSIFRFLDEESSFLEDLKIITSLNQKAFRSTLFKSF